MNPTKTYLKELVYLVNGAAIAVHKAIGPGLLENVYHKCLKEEFIFRNIPFISEKNVTFLYHQKEIITDMRCDFLIDNILALEIKAIETIHPVHQAQILSYMNLLQVPIGLLINFNVYNLYKEGQKTFVNELYRNLKNA